MSELTEEGPEAQPGGPTEGQRVVGKEVPLRDAYDQTEMDYQRWE